MRLGGSIVGPYAGAAAFAAMAKECGFRAVTFPLSYRDSDEEITRLVGALKDADIRIAELGAWGNNPLSKDKKEKLAALENIKKQLALADSIEAPCCVNVAGSHTALWDGPSPDYADDAVFNEVVETVQEIVDAVKPTHTFYSLEPMPFMLPYSPETYVRLLEAVDRPSFAVHLDTVNMINSPERYYTNSLLTQECFDKFGSRIKSIHIKDIILRNSLTVHLDECLVGTGGYDLACLLRNAASCDPDIPVLVEHIKDQWDYKHSIAFLNRFLKEHSLH
jgi:sugar phosphate isomerase/epimerase